MRSTESVFGKTSSDTPEPSSSAETVDETLEVAPDGDASSETTETPAPVTASEPATGDDDDDEPLGADPSDLEGLKKALANSRKGERKHRKEARELTRKLDQLTGFVSARGQQHQPQQPNPQQPQAKKPGEDDEAYWQGPQKFVREVVDQRFGSVEERLEAQRVQFQRTRIADREEAFVEKHEDAREHLDYFKALAASNPELVAQFEAVADGKRRDYRDPIKFAYDVAKAHKQAVEMSDPVAYEAKLRAKWEAERNGETTDQTPRAPTNKAPKSIVHSRGTGGASKQAWSGPRSTEAVFAKNPG